MAADTLKQSIAELLGKEPGDLKPENGPSVFDNWQNYLTAQGYDITAYSRSESVNERHVIVYLDAYGEAQGVVSDDPKAGKVDVLVRFTVTKAAKAGDSKEA
jgi:hypothetical protein